MSHLLPSLALAGAIAIAYWNSFWGVFQFDDFNVIVGNHVIHSWAAWLSDVPFGIRPVLKFTYMLNWVFGVGVFGFHLVNIAVHVTNAILVYLLSLRFLGYNPYEAMKKVAFVSALIFAIHPVQTEAVSYISGRSTSLMAMFYLGSLLAYVHGSHNNRRWWLYMVSPLLFIMAVLTKEVAVTLPLAILLWERLKESKGTWRLTLRKQVVHWSLLAFMFIGVLAHNGYLKLVQTCFRIRGVKENLLSQINGINYLISRLFDINSLNIDPDLPVVSEWNLLLISEAALLSLLILIGLFGLKRRPSLGFGLIWFFLHLFPTNSFVPRLDIANERQLYLASWGVILALCVEAEKMRISLSQGQILFRVGIIILSLILCFFTIARNHVYRSEVALWEDTVRKSPNKARVYNNLGYAYYLSGRYYEARKAYLAALHLKVDYTLARNNLALLERKILCPNNTSN